MPIVPILDRFLIWGFDMWVCIIGGFVGLVAMIGFGVGFVDYLLAFSMVSLIIEAIGGYLEYRG